MASRRGVLVAIGTLTAAGVRPPWTDEDGQAQTTEVWYGLLGSVDDGRLVEAVAVYLVSADARWWPLPGQLLALVPPTPPARQIEAVQHPCPLRDEPGTTGQALVDAVDSIVDRWVISGVLPAPCGGCPVRRECLPGAAWVHVRRQVEAAQAEGAA